MKITFCEKMLSIGKIILIIRRYKLIKLIGAAKGNKEKGLVSMNSISSSKVKASKHRIPINRLYK